MFEHFTFGAVSQSRQEEDFDFLSPTDTSFLPAHTPHKSCPCPPHYYNSQHSEQTLLQRSRDALIKQFEAWQMDQTELEVDDSETSDEPTSLPHISIGASVPCRRLQRQLNAQLLSCSSHMKDINSLVEGMITSNSQCNIRAPSRPSSPHSDMEKLVVDTREADGMEDEGYCDGEEELGVSLRRAATPAGIRKGGVRYGRSVDVAREGLLKVKCVPRMRRRKVVVRRE